MKKLFFTSVLFLSALIAFGAADKKQQDPLKNPFANPVDKPGLPRVLIVGDSISIMYTTRVRRLLDGKANVHRPAANCQWAAYGDEHIEEWIGDSKWDVIHFNFGLWDWYGWSQKEKATPESYAASLESIVKKLKKTKAKLIFAVTTPPCVKGERKVKIVITEKRAKEFNDAAIAVMKKHGVRINDLYSVIGKDRAKYQLAENDVHYKPEGCDLLAAKVADIITKALPVKDEQSLFNGKDLTGWSGAPGVWRIEDGAITAESTPEKPCKTDTYLIWKGGEPADFELRADFRLSEKANSGLQIRSQDLSNWKVSGYQADMTGDGNLIGFVYHHKRGLIAARGTEVNIAKDGKRTEEKLADPKELLKSFKPGDWNTYRVICKGQEITLFVNDVMMCRFIDHDARYVVPKGVIALQMHPGPPMKVQFKNIFLKSL